MRSFDWKMVYVCCLSIGVLGTLILSASLHGEPRAEQVAASYRPLIELTALLLIVFGCAASAFMTYREWSAAQFLTHREDGFFTEIFLYIVGKNGCYAALAILGFVFITIKGGESGFLFSLYFLSLLGISIYMTKNSPRGIAMAYEDFQGRWVSR